MRDKRFAISVQGNVLCKLVLTVVYDTFHVME